MSTGRYSSGPAFIRSTHPVSFRSGEWAKITGVSLKRVGHEPGGHDSWRPCYVIEFGDGTTDEWAIYDAASYEFRSKGEVRAKFEACDRSAERVNPTWTGGPVERNRGRSTP